MNIWTRKILSNIHMDTHNRNLYRLYSSPNIVMVFKTRKLKWVWYMIQLGEIRRAHIICLGNIIEITLEGRCRRTVFK
jgi:hypothetical protein